MDCLFSVFLLRVCVRKSGWTYRECICVFKIWVLELSKVAAFGTQNHAECQMSTLSQINPNLTDDLKYQIKITDLGEFHKLSKTHPNLSEIESNLTFAEGSQF